MRGIKFITTFLLLFILGIFISYADVEYNNWAENFLEAFEKTNAKFKFYNIKINTVISNTESEKDIKQMCVDITNCFNISKNQINWNVEREKNKLNIYAKVKNSDCSISFIATKKNNKEYYIIIDISNNKVYKNIVDIYQTLDKLMSKYSDNTKISTCIVGEYTKNLQLYKFDDILNNILYNMNAKEIDKIRNDNYISVTAYSNFLKKNNLEYLENKINLNIGIRYSENEDKTLIYMATPIIKLDY